MNGSEVNFIMQVLQVCVPGLGNISARFIYGFEVRPYESENGQFSPEDN